MIILTYRLSNLLPWQDLKTKLLIYPRGTFTGHYFSSPGPVRPGGVSAGLRPGRGEELKAVDILWYITPMG